MAFLGLEHDIAHPERWPIIFAVDRLVDFLFFVDIVINFRSAWYVEDGTLVVFDQAVATKSYLRGWFVLDFISLVPFEVIGLGVTVGDGSSVLRLPKLLKIMRLVKILKLLRASRVVTRIEQNLGIKYGIVRLAKFVWVLVIIAHWLACLLMYISTLDDAGQADFEECLDVSNGAEDLQNKWRYQLYCGCGCSTSQLYLAALYWSTMTLTTIGYGDVSPVNGGEMVFMIISMLLGAAVFSFVVGTCCTVVEGLDRVGLQFQGEVDALNDYMQICDFPKPVRRRVRAYLSRNRDMSSTKNEDEVLSLLSPALRDEFVLHNHSRIIRAVPPLAGAPDRFVVEMSQVAAKRLYGGGDAITFQGSRGDPFYLLRKGEVVMCRISAPGRDMDFAGRMRNAGFWNERLLVFDSFSDCSVKAVTFAEVVSFDSAKVRALLSRFPQGRVRVKKIVLQRLWRFAASKASIRHAIDALTVKEAEGLFEAAQEPAAEVASTLEKELPLTEVQM